MGLQEVGEHDIESPVTQGGREGSRYLLAANDTPGILLTFTKT